MKKATTKGTLSWSEDKLQAKFYSWFHNTFPPLRGLLLSIPNGGARGGFEAKVLKATGTYAGAADMMFLYNGITYFIELKRPDGLGVQSSKQKDWEAQVTKHGFEYFISNDFNSLKWFVLDKITNSKLKSNEKIIDKAQIDMFQ